CILPSRFLLRDKWHENVPHVRDSGLDQGRSKTVIRTKIPKTASIHKGASPVKKPQARARCDVSSK
ncbi:hypothetical protein ACM73V_21685, partial [Pseudomonas aeruginosa]